VDIDTSAPANLIAGPPPANPPAFIVIIILGLSITAPFLFLRAGAPSPFFGIILLALAAASIITMSAAVKAARRRRADGAVRLRASITSTGITFHPGPTALDRQHFPASSIKSTHLLPNALIIQTIAPHPNPGRHVLRFGKLAIPRQTLQQALATISNQLSSPAGDSAQNQIDPLPMPPLHGFVVRPQNGGEPPPGE
jgi:hypothetical protein